MVMKGGTPPVLTRVLTVGLVLISSLCRAVTNEASPTAPPPVVAATTPAAAQLPTTDELMGRLLARLPSKPILVTGDLITTAETGEKSKLGVSILLCYPRMAQYTILDAFGQQLEQLTVLRQGNTASLEYVKGDPAAGAPAPALGQQIQTTALSWMDLTLGFLWWHGGNIIGREETRGQPCYVLDRHAPANEAEPYASVRIWVDTRVSMLLQADGYDKLGDGIRRLSVKSFKKINDEWMIKDLEIEHHPSKLRTILRVRDVQPIEVKESSSSQ